MRNGVNIGEKPEGEGGEDDDDDKGIEGLLALFLYVAAEKHKEDQRCPEKDRGVILPGGGEVELKQCKAGMG